MTTEDLVRCVLTGTQLARTADVNGEPVLLTWCGRTPGTDEWCFVDAACALMPRGRLLVCRVCSRAMVEILRETTRPEPEVHYVHTLLVCGTILRECDYAGAAAQPGIGDEVEIDDVRYRVANRVWEFPLHGAPSVAIILTRRWPP